MQVFVVTDFDSDRIKIGFNVEGIFPLLTRLTSKLGRILEGEGGNGDEAPEVPPADEDENEDETIYKPDLEDLDPPKGEIGELDIEELEGRGVNDNWTSLDYLVKGFKRKSASNHKLVPIDRTPHEIHYINYLQQMTCV